MTECYGDKGPEVFILQKWLSVKLLFPFINPNPLNN